MNYDAPCTVDLAHGCCVREMGHIAITSASQPMAERVLPISCCVREVSHAKGMADECVQAHRTDTVAADIAKRSRPCVASQGAARCSKAATTRVASVLTEKHHVKRQADVSS